ncbi:hypothetical protein BC332_07558 [Capsicum chinense]|nr:hypothetical protein BC332_07558 [Capsicum chinense]
MSTTMRVQPGPVIEFLLENQNTRDPYQIDWAKAKRMLKSLRIMASPSNMEHKITSLTDNSCKEQIFMLKQKNMDRVFLPMLAHFERGQIGIPNLAAIDPRHGVCPGSNCPFPVA